MVRGNQMLELYLSWLGPIVLLIAIGGVESIFAAFSFLGFRHLIRVYLLHTTKQKNLEKDSIILGFSLVFTVGGIALVLVLLSEFGMLSII